MKALVVLIFLFSLQTLAWNPGEIGRFDITANPMQSGDAIELGYSSKGLFKLREDSRHIWSVFSSLGILTYSNVITENEDKVIEVLSPELIVGIQAHANFYNDFIYQYGKVAFDTVFYDSKLRESIGIGGLLETGLEFKSSVEKMAFHIGLRWRFGLPSASKLDGEPDPFEGSSIVFGTRFFF